MIIGHLALLEQGLSIDLGYLHFKADSKLLQILALKYYGSMLPGQWTPV